MVNYAAAIVVKNVQAKSSLLDPIQTPKAKECLVNFDTQTLHIGQWKERNNFKILHWLQFALGFYK